MSTVSLEIATKYARDRVAVDFCERDAREDLQVRIRSSRDPEWVRAVALGLVEACRELATLRDQEANQFAARLRAQGYARVVPGKVRADGVVIPEIHMHIDAGAIQVQHTTHVDPGAVQLEVDAGAADMDVVRDGNGNVSGVRKV
jgi:hypothetical protein